MEPKMYTKGLFNYTVETFQEKEIVDDAIVVKTRREITIYQRDDANYSTQVIGNARHDGRSSEYHFADGEDLLTHYPVITALVEGHPETVEGLTEVSLD